MKQNKKATYLNMESDIKVLSRSKSLLQLDEIAEIASRFGIVGDEVIEAVRFLNDLGSLQYFEQNGLRDKVVINPQWIVDVVACVVSVQNSVIVDGRLYHKDLARLWRDYDERLHEWMLKLTEEFDLTSPVVDKRMSIVPCLLAEREPSVISAWHTQTTTTTATTTTLTATTRSTTAITLETTNISLPSVDIDEPSGVDEAKTSSRLSTMPPLQAARSEDLLRVVYSFEYLPAGLFNRFQVRLFEYGDESLIWKRGSLLAKSEHRALVRQSSPTSIDVRVHGVKPTNLALMLHEVLETLISESFGGIHYEYSVACPHCVNEERTTATTVSSESDPWLFSSLTVRRATEKRAAFLQCAKSFHVVSIAELLAIMPPLDGLATLDLSLEYALGDLTHIRKRLKYDVFFWYCDHDSKLANESDMVDPVQVAEAIARGTKYAVWYTKRPRFEKFDQLVYALKEARVVVLAISDKFAADDTSMRVRESAQMSCRSIFSLSKYFLLK